MAIAVLGLFILAVSDRLGLVFGQASWKWLMCLSVQRNKLLSIAFLLYIYIQ